MVVNSSPECAAVDYNQQPEHNTSCTQDRLRVPGLEKKHLEHLLKGSTEWFWVWCLQEKGKPSRTQMFLSLAAGEGLGPALLKSPKSWLSNPAKPTWWAVRCRGLSEAGAWAFSSPGTHAGWWKGLGRWSTYPCHSTLPLPPGPLGYLVACRTKEKRKVGNLCLKTILDHVGLEFLNKRLPENSSDPTQYPQGIPRDPGFPVSPCPTQACPCPSVLNELHGRWVSQGCPTLNCTDPIPEGQGLCCAMAVLHKNSWKWARVIKSCTEQIKPSDFIYSPTSKCHFAARGEPEQH